LEGLSDESPRALELHNRRKAALHDVLDNEKAIEVLNWGEIDDTQSHEFVEITVGALATTILTYAVVPGVKYVAEKLAEKAVDQASSELTKWLISKLRPKQESNEILDFQIRLPDGTQIHCDPPDGQGEIRIAFTDGAVSSITYMSQDMQ
jgi:hypothetical protein